MLIRKLTVLLAAIFILVAGTQVAQAQTASSFAVQPAISGNWFNPDESGHGIMIEILPDNGVWICWFTFTATGDKSWICGQGTYSGNTITMDAFTVEGGAFPPLFDPGNISILPWGTFVITITDCNNGTFEWTTDRDGFESGMMPLRRVSALAGLICDPEASVLTVPKTSSAVSVDGALASGEWDSAVKIVLSIRPDWPVVIYLQSDGTQLFVAFEGVAGPNDENRVNAALPATTFPELFFHADPANATANLDQLTHWFHMSFQDCYDRGRVRSVRQCAPQLGAWIANNWPLGATGDVIEVAIPLAVMEVASGDRLRFMATMTSSLVGDFVYHNWPADSHERMPDSWPFITIE